ncbi:MAG: helicase-exonuclease AddAB subunit AddA [Clostridia bacterium]|nr:helicase-exonuclease AddAB subunit AddA [Clostridia bacterium]
MAERKWTDPQRDSFTARGGSLLVSAAAGSGKTAVLVERIIRRITDPVNPVDVDRLLVVTFTRAAAAEMRQRLSNALAAKMAEEPDNPRYARQQMLLPRAYISTVDAFCARILQEFAGQTGLPMGFAVAEDARAELLSAEALDTVLEEAYRAKDPAFLALAAQLCSNRDDSGLRDAVLGAYRFMQAQPFPDEWLQQQMDAYTVVKPLETTAWMVPILKECRFILRRAVAVADAAIVLSHADGVDKYTDTLTLDRNTLEAVIHRLEGLTYDEMQAVLAACTFGRLPMVKASDEAMQERKERIQKLRDEVKDGLKKVKGLFCGTEAECRADLAEMAPLVEALGQLVRAYTRRFTELKRAQKLLDYNDLEHETIALLIDKTTRKPTPLAVELSHRFAEIMVDEYQDTNKAQDALFMALARPEGNLFMVGDVKQSIYGFRQAMPAIFTDRRDEYTPYNRDAEQFPAAITLSNNFRSRKDVTETVNFLFRQLMMRSLGGVDYGATEQLEATAAYPDDTRPTQWILVDRDAVAEQGLTDVQAEARVIAARIHGMMADTTVTEDKKQRPMAYEDICILLRKRGDMPAFVKELGRLGIPAAADKGEGFLSTPEIRAALSLLRVVDNPLRAVELTAVMLSPLYGFTPDDLAQLRITYSKHMPLYSAVEQMATNEEYPDLAGRCRVLLGDLRRFRTLAVTMPADRLLETIYRDTGMEEIYAARGGGRQRVANLRRLDQIARGYEQGEFRGLSAFVRYVDGLEEKGKDLEGADTLHRNGVRVMTVHGSKGLEFPVVFVARLGAGRGRDDNRQKLRFHATTGIGMKLVDEEAGEKRVPLPYAAVQSSRRLDDAAEELRVWYVALTRAREKLILVHSLHRPLETLQTMAANLPSGEPLLEDTLIRAATPGEMLLMAALRHPDFRPLWHGDTPELACKVAWQVTVCSLPTSEEVEAAIPAAPVDTALAQELTARTRYTYPYAPLQGVPAKLAASQLSHEAMHRRHIAASRPAFLQEAGMTPAQKGTATHTFMQFADYAMAARDAAAEAQRLTAAGFLTPRQAEVLDLNKIAAFFNSALYRRMTAAQAMWREYHFAVTVPAGTLTDLPHTMAQEAVLVQGIADCLFREGDRLILVDYKTDKVKAADELRDRYRSQMTFYKQALEAIFNLPVEEMLLYSFALGETVEV